MKKILIATAIVLMVGCDAAQADYSQPLENTKYVQQDRFVTVKTSGFVDRVITDRKTGCQWLAVGGNDWNLEPLGCFQEYKADLDKAAHE